MDIYYINSINEKVYLDRYPYRMLSVTGLFNYEYKYEKKRNNTVKNIKKDMRTAPVSIDISGKSFSEYYENVVKLYEIIDYDAVTRTPGRLYVGEYYLECYFYKSEKTNKYINVKHSTVSFSVVTNKVNWVREITQMFRNNYNFIVQEGADLDYPHGYPHDYMPQLPVVNNSSFYPSEFILRIYGHVVNPSINIGEHDYTVYTTLETGDYLTIDSRRGKIYKTKVDGEVENQFKYRDRESYIFEPIPRGISTILWDGYFGFDLTVFDERGEPKWS